VDTVYDLQPGKAYELRDVYANAMENAYQLSVSETLTPWSVVRPDEGVKETVSVAKSETFAVGRVLSKACLTVLMSEDMVKGKGT